MDAAINEAGNALGIEYTEEQRDAIKKVCSSNVCILTGYGGTGKSTVVAGVLKVLRGKSFAQTALSGRAAARMQEITGQDGKTIHRLLGYDIENGGFVHDKDNPLDDDIIILDETSMVGAQLFYDLIQAIETGKRFIMIGDDGQLESIGMCNIFKDTDFGIYPMVTSSNTIAGYGAVGAGIPPYEIKEIITVVKAYSSAVGAGEFVSEIFGDEADELRRRGGDA